MTPYHLKGTPRQGIIGSTLGFFVGFAAVSLFGPTAHAFKNAMHLTPMMVGFLVAIPSLSGSLLRIPFATWVDTSGGRRPFLVLLILSIAGMLGLSLLTFLLSPDLLGPNLYPLILFLGVLCGCGIATFSVGISQVSYWYPQAMQGRALGTYAGIGNLAPGIFTLLLPLAMGSLGLAGSYLAWLILLCAGTALYYVIGCNCWYFQLVDQGLSPAEARSAARHQGQEIFPTGGLKESLFLSARAWKTWALVAVYFTTFGGFIALTAWFPTYWRSFYGVSAVTAGVLTAAFSILTSVVRVAGGMISDRLGGENTALSALLTMILGAVIMTVSHTQGLSVAGEIVMALGMGVANASVFKLVPQEVPQAVGGASGWVGGLGAFGGFIIPPIMASCVTNFGSRGYPLGFAAFILFASLSLFLAYVLKRAHSAQAIEPAYPGPSSKPLPE